MKCWHIILILLIIFNCSIDENMNLPILFVNAKPKPKGKGKGAGKGGGASPPPRKRKLKIDGTPLEIFGRLVLIHGLSITIFTFCMYKFCCEKAKEVEHCSLQNDIEQNMRE